MLTLNQFDYHLPPQRIAQSPLEPRDSSRLLRLDRDSAKMSDQHFYDLEKLLTPNDVLVLNNTKVFPARIFASQGNKQVEVLLEKEISLSGDSITFSALTKPGLKLGEIITLANSSVTAEVIGVDGYTRKLKFNLNREAMLAFLDQWAHTPIPPYIKWHEADEIKLREKYQTVFAQRQGAVAAPTAGLHFTSTLLEKLKTKGVQLEYVTLHVGLGTFLPVKTDDVTQHHMHEEWFELDEQTAHRLTLAKQSGKRIIAVGTTSVRVLETCAQNGQLVPQTGNTQIYIYPPYKFKFVDSLITNFHTPKSTLLMLVCALVSTPNTQENFTDFSHSLVGKAYQHALENQYRFYSFGDAMWIV